MRLKYTVTRCKRAVVGADARGNQEEGACSAQGDAGAISGQTGCQPTAPGATLAAREQRSSTDRLRTPSPALRSCRRGRAKAARSCRGADSDRAAQFGHNGDRAVSRVREDRLCGRRPRNGRYLPLPRRLLPACGRISEGAVTALQPSARAFLRRLCPGRNAQAAAAGAVRARSNCRSTDPGAIRPDRRTLWSEGDELGCAAGSGRHADTFQAVPKYGYRRASQAAPTSAGSSST